MAAKSVDKFVVAAPFDRRDPETRVEKHWDPGEGDVSYVPVSEEEKQLYLERGLIIPAPAGSNQPGSAKKDEESA